MSGQRESSWVSTVRLHNFQDLCVATTELRRFYSWLRLQPGLKSCASSQVQNSNPRAYQRCEGPTSRKEREKWGTQPERESAWNDEPYLCERQAMSFGNTVIHNVLYRTQEARADSIARVDRRSEFRVPKK